MKIKWVRLALDDIDVLIRNGTREGYLECISKEAKEAFLESRRKMEEEARSKNPEAYKKIEEVLAQCEAAGIESREVYTEGLFLITYADAPVDLVDLHPGMLLIQRDGKTEERPYEKASREQLNPKALESLAKRVHHI